MTRGDYYDILGVSRSASPEELKSAFRKLARQYHPDVSQEADAEERFKEISEAYAVLSDPEKRAAYDRFGHAGVQGAGGAPPDFTVDLADILEELFGGLGGFGRSSQRMRNAPRRGADLQLQLDLSFEEAVFGVEREIEITRDEICTHCQGRKAEPGTTPQRCTSCGGRGEVRQVRQTILGSLVQVATCPTCGGGGETISSPCTVCGGRGLERKTRTKMVNIPAGVDTGNQIRLAGEGQPGANNGPYGNLYLLINVRPHKFFRRRDNDILLDLEINIAQAVLGSEVEVPSVDGPLKLRIPAGIQPGKVLRMRGKGVPSLRSNDRGDQLVIVNIAIPKTLTPEQRKLFEELARTMGTEAQPQSRGILDWIKDALGG